MDGETVVRVPNDRRYDLIDPLPEAFEIRTLHARDLSGSRDELFKCVSGWPGDLPPRMQEYGHPMPGLRHLRFPTEVGAWNQ
ncbi:hypothetical protein [Thioalkalivibrio nitratireducens]|nr:hypothetical protein [Thioalkalivibrio nitratireducens]